MRSYTLFLSVITLFLVTGCFGDDRGAFEPDDDRLQILVVGDSQLEFHRGEGESIPDRVGEALNANVVHMAVGGAYISNTENPDAEGFDIRGQFIDEPWDLLIMDGGGNDLNEECGCGDCTETLGELISEDGLSGEVPEFLDEVTGRDIPVIFVGYYFAPPTAAFGFGQCNEPIAEYKLRLERYIEANEDVHYVDMAEYIDPENLDFYHEDHIHPSPLTTSIIGDQITGKILEIAP